MKKDFLDSINVKSPCHESWEEMTGNDEVRLCSHCAKDVHDLSALTRAQAERLVKNSKGNICVRYVKTPQGKLVTAPPRLTQIKRQARVAAGIFAASLALSTLAYSQGEPLKPKENKAQTVKKISRTDETKKELATISGTVKDPNGASIAGAKVALRGVSHSQMMRFTNEEGSYEFLNVEPDIYEIEIESPGFKKMVVTNIAVAENERLEQSAFMEVAEATTGLLVITSDPLASSESQIPPPVQSQELLELPPNNQKIFTMGMIPAACAEEKPKSEKPKKTKKKKN